MMHRSLLNSAGLALGCLLAAGTGSVALAQEGEGARVTAPGLFMKVDWVRPTAQENTKVRYMPVQDNIADANVLISYYGAGAKQVLTTGQPNSLTAPYGIWSGTAESPFAMTFKLKNGNYVDLTGLASIRWGVKTSGFHEVRPVLKLANGTLIVGDVGFKSITRVTVNEFAPVSVHWIKLDPQKIVTLNSGREAANPSGEIWAPNPDLSKVEEIGFVDLMPGSGHGTGGWIQLANIEVYGKPVPRVSASN